MKIYTISISLIAALGATARLFSRSPHDSWDDLDLKEYLNDHNVYFIPDSKIEELRKLSRKNWEQEYATVAKPTPWYSPQTIKQRVFNRYDDSATKPTNDDWYHFSYSDVKDWVFSTWSSEDIRNLLDQAKVKYNTKSSHSQLVQLAKDNYNNIAKAKKASGKYPGGWLYDKWTEKSLKRWLDEYGVTYSPSESKEQLSRKVRQYAYKAAQFSEDQRQGIVDSLDLADKSLFDKAGELKDDIFNTWSPSQLYNWLLLNKIEVAQSAKSNQREMIALAQKHKNDLKNDIDSWVKKVSRKSSPVVSKSPPSEKVDNVINDTFFVGVEKWSNDRLKSFLTSRGVAIPLLATKHHLVKLVKDNKFKPIKTFNNNDFFQGWSKENLMKWAGTTTDTDSSSISDIMEKATDHYKQFVANAESYANQIANKVSDVVSDAASHVSTKGAEVYAQAAKKGAEMYTEASKHGAKVYDEGSKQAAKAYDEGSKQAAKVYDEGSKQAAKAYDEGSKQAAKAYVEGSKQAANAYNEASKRGSKAAADAYLSASKHGAKAAAGASKKSAELYAQAAKKSMEAKDSFFNYWSDVELKTYLKTFGIYDTKGYSREDLLDIVKKNTRWFVSGSKYDVKPSKYGLTGLRYYLANLQNHVIYKLSNYYNYVYYTFN